MLVNSENREERCRITKGIWIPIEIWEDENLSWNEKILLLEIDSFTSKGRDCYVSNEYIAKLLGIRETSANKVLSSLINKGYVVKTSFDGRRRFVKSALHLTTSQGCSEQQGSIALKSNIPNIDNNTSTDIEKENNKLFSKESEEERLKLQFAEFAKEYKKLFGKHTVTSIPNAYKEFTKRHKDWRDVIPMLMDALHAENDARTSAVSRRVFFPSPKNLTTYLGKQRAWEAWSDSKDASLFDGEVSISEKLIINGIEYK